MPPTLRDIAAELGVSVMTVSRALRNAPGLSADTRQKIQAAARRLGYQPNPYVQAFVHSRRRPAESRRATLGLVNPWFDLKTYRSNPANIRFIEGVRSRAKALGYGLDLFKLDPTPAGEATLARILHARGIRGVIFHWFRDVEAGLTLDLGALACVTVGYSLRQPALNRVVADHFGNTVIALDALHRAGLTRVGLLLSDRLDRRLTRVRAACALARQNSQIAPIPDLILDSAFGPAEAKETTVWLRRHRPQAVLVYGGYFRNWLCTQTGPAPTPFVIVDLNRHAAETAPDDCGVDQQNVVMGERCVEVVAAQLMQNTYGPPATPSETVIPGRWHGPLRAPTPQQPR